MLALLLSVALIPAPPIEQASECVRLRQHIIDSGQEWYFTNWPGYTEHCPDLIPWFRTTEDKLHILVVAQCESGFDPDANSRRWGHLRYQPRGLLSFQDAYSWPARLGSGDGPDGNC